MKRQMRFLVAVALVIVAAGTGSQAFAYGEGSAARQGFFAGGGASVGAETGPLDKFGGGGALRLGYGVSDNVLLYLDNNYFYTKTSGVAFNFFDTEAKVQYFPLGGLFLAGGGGVSIGKPGAGLGSKVGWTTSYTTGYEFRPKEQLALSAEGGFRYRRISGTNFYSPLAGARLDWYF